MAEKVPTCQSEVIDSNVCVFCQKNVICTCCLSLLSCCCETTVFLQGMLCFGVEALKDIRQILLLVTGQLEWFI